MHGNAALNGCSLFQMEKNRWKSPLSTIGKYDGAVTATDVKQKNEEKKLAKNNFEIAMYRDVNTWEIWCKKHSTEKKSL